MIHISAPLNIHGRTKLTTRVLQRAPVPAREQEPQTESDARAGHASVARTSSIKMRGRSWPDRRGRRCEGI